MNARFNYIATRFLQCFGAHEPFLNGGIEIVGNPYFAVSDDLKLFMSFVHDVGEFVSR
jgi:hypothetical protein